MPISHLQALLELSKTEITNYINNLSPEAQSKLMDLSTQVETIFETLKNTIKSSLQNRQIVPGYAIKVANVQKWRADVNVEYVIKTFEKHNIPLDGVVVKKLILPSQMKNLQKAQTEILEQFLAPQGEPIISLYKPKTKVSE